MIGTTIGQYEVREKLAQGGMATVFRAYQPALGREVAVKVLSHALADQPGFLERFANEARVLARLEHPNILPVYDFGSLDGITYIVTPLIEEGTLADRLDRGGIPTEVALDYLGQIADALHHAHQVGITHRDLKPGNVLLHRAGWVMLADFGLARAGDRSSVTMTGIALGTPGYMAPEQALGGQVDARADIYALGVVAFEVLTGSRPYRGDAREVIMATVQAPIPSARMRNPSLPPALDVVLGRALAKNPSDRHASAREFMRALEAAFTMAPGVTGRPVQTSGRTTLAAPGTELQPAVWPAVTPTPPPPTPPGRREASQPVRVAGRPPSEVLREHGVALGEATGRAILNAHFAHAFHAAVHVAGERWDDLVAASGLPYLTTDPPDDDELGTPVHELAWLNEAMELTFGSNGGERQRLWGALTMQVEIERTPSLSGYRRRLRMMPAGHQRRLRGLLGAYCERMDAIRGEHLHAWLRVSAKEMWVTVGSNPYVFGKRKPQPSCHAIVGQLETMLRWIGLANDWLVQEIECGCVTGAADCVFAVRSARAV